MTGRIIAVGDLVTDVLAVLAGPPAPGSDTAARVRLTGGGQAANTAAWLAASGVPVSLVAVVGDDPAGHALTAELTAGGVDCAVRRVRGATTGCVVVLAHAAGRDGERTMITDRGASGQLRPVDVDAALDRLPDVRHLHLSGYALLDGGSRAAGRHALTAARTRGLTTSVDAASAAPLRRVGATHFREWIRGVDLLLANADEAATLASADEAAARARDLTQVAGAVVVKLGGAGALWAAAGGPVVRVEASPVAVVDATGAGDAFAAGLLTAWLTDPDPGGALRAGARLGAAAVATAGARPPIAG